MHRRSKVMLGLVALALTALALPALSAAGRNTTEVEATLKGANEVPGPGDPNGKGEISVRLKPKKEKVCFNLELDKIDGASAGHIHKGDEDTAGKIKVPLFEEDPPLPIPGSFEGCVKNVKRKLIKRIAANPEKYYVNVHNAEYPEGAIRGQLELAEDTNP
ncbi:MAG TPA: CHRD domain-containing protein [Solirubrobacterales bacterium]|nr:CHRD domain-containing protein [Solirubrobacterales bacterium]